MDGRRSTGSVSGPTGAPVGFRAASAMSRGGGASSGTSGKWIRPRASGASASGKVAPAVRKRGPRGGGSAPRVRPRPSAASGSSSFHRPRAPPASGANMGGVVDLASSGDDDEAIEGFDDISDHDNMSCGDLSKLYAKRRRRSNGGGLTPVSSKRQRRQLPWET